VEKKLGCDDGIFDGDPRFSEKSAIWMVHKRLLDGVRHALPRYLAEEREETERVLGGGET